MFDSEVLRNQQLIEERIEYENDFIYIKGIIKSEELDNYTHPQFEVYYNKEYIFDTEHPENNKLDLEFDFEDYCNQLRDEHLIEMHESQINSYFEIDDSISEYDPLEAAIDTFENQFIPEYEYFNNYDDYFNDCYIEEISMDAAYCGGKLVGYIVNDNSICEYDYPEGPDENLQGLKFNDPCYLNQYEFELPNTDIPDDFYNSPEPEYEIENEYEEYLFDIEEKSMQKLINERIQEENEFFEYIKEFEVKDKYLLPLECNNIILC